MSELNKCLAEVLEPIYRQVWQNMLNHFDKKDLGMFFPQWGSKWQSGRGIMIVGKANNGWDKDFDDIFRSGEVTEKASDITWIQRRFYVPEAGHTWTGSRSAFFRTMKKITLKCFPEAQDENWSQWIVYNDLYKIAPAGSGNPSGKMCSKQFLDCAKMLEKEISIFNPRAIVFLTSTWEIPFLREITGENFVSNLIVHGTGNTSCQYGEWNGYKIICTSHPQGKKESVLVENVCQEIIDRR